MDRRAEKLLLFLKDGRWHRKVGRVASVGVIEACACFKLIHRKLIKRTRENGLGYHIGSFRISRYGREALRRGDSPSRRELSAGIHWMSCASFRCRHRLSSAELLAIIVKFRLR